MQQRYSGGNTGYATFKASPKDLVQSDGIGPGQIRLDHLDPSLFSEIRKIALHEHSGAGSRKINLRNLEGSFGINGFVMYSSDGTKRYRVTINSGTGAFVLTEI